MPWKTMLKDLAIFSNELENIEATQLTAFDLQASHSKFIQQWKSRELVSEEGISLPLPRKKGLHPSKCELSECKLKFKFSVGDDIVDGIWVGPRLAAFTVCVKGMYKGPDAIAILEDHWRVDTHEQEKDLSVEPHPRIHFQRGGHAQDDFANLPKFVPGADLPALQNGERWRGLLQGPAPRIPVPPMCPLLAIDFTIAQHDGLIWSSLRRSATYRNIVARAQERLWKPYFEALTDENRRERWIGPLFSGE